MIITNGKIFDLLDPLAKGISKHLFKLNFQNRYNLIIDTDKFIYIVFSDEGWDGTSLSESNKYVYNMLCEYSFNVQSWSDKRNSDGFGSHNEITVIFEVPNLNDNRKELVQLSKSFTTINKFQL